MSYTRGDPSFKEAVEIVRGHRGGTSGLAEATLAEALQSGEVDFHADDTLIGVFDLQIDARMVRREMSASMNFVSRTDLLGWLARNHKLRVAKRESAKRPVDLCKEAARKRWGEKGPPSHLSNGEVHTAILGKLPKRLKYKPSLSSAMRAVGRKKD